MKDRARNRATTGAAKKDGDRRIASGCIVVPASCAPVAASFRRASISALLFGAFLLILPVAAQAEPAALLLGLSAAPTAAPQAAPDHTLEALFNVPDPSPARFLAQDPDDAIVAAVAAGTNPELEPRKPFRKKNFDLFRTDRKVEIGNQEMVVRFRLRAKSKETVSVELRF